MTGNKLWILSRIMFMTGIVTMVLSIWLLAAGKKPAVKRIAGLALLFILGLLQIAPLAINWFLIALIEQAGV